jgi:hypothetical protein
VHEHRAQVAEQDAAGFGETVSLLHREVDADAEKRGEQRVRERPHDQAKRGGQQRLGQRFTVGDVENVFQPGETRADQARVDEAVGQRVELVATPAGHHEQQEQALSGLFCQRGAEHHGKRADRLRVADRVRVEHRFGVDLDDRG